MPRNISTITINTSLQKVWNAITKPEHVKQWQFGSELLTSWEPGTSIRFNTEWEGQLFQQWGTVLEYKPLELIRYSLFAPRPGLEDKPAHYFEMNYVLTTDNGQTKLEIIQIDDRPGAVQEAPQGEENSVLQGLKNVAEQL